MSPVRIAVVVSAALIGSIGLALFARSMATPPKAAVVAAAPVVTAPPMTRVLVAAHDLQPGDRLTKDDFTWQDWPKKGLNPDFVTDGPTPSAQAPLGDKLIGASTLKVRDTLAGGAAGASADYIGAIVRSPMLRGEPLVPAKVVSRGKDAGVLAVTLNPGMRAMSVPMSAENAAGGFILPGDHVDVMQSRKVDLPFGAGQRFASGSILRNVRVLAVDQDTHASDKAPAKVGSTATLEVTPEQAEFLALSKSQGDLTLILRSYADIGGGSTEGNGPSLGRGAGFAPTTVRVYRNGAPADVMVSR